METHANWERFVMAKVRSPNYPLMDLGTALEAARPALKAENRNKMSRAVLAKHLGYNSLNGRALGKIGAIRAYGLIDGSGDDLRISDDAVTALLNPDKGVVYRDALRRLADKPGLFQEIQKQYPSDLPSETNLAFWLVQQKHFTQEAAAKAAKTFLSTMRLVYDAAGSYNPPSEPSEDDMQTQVTTGPRPATRAVPTESNLSPGGVPLRVVMNGNRLDIQASVDLEGLKKLQTMLEKYQGILEMMEPEVGTAPKPPPLPY